MREILKMKMIEQGLRVDMWAKFPVMRAHLVITRKLWINNNEKKKTFKRILIRFTSNDQRLTEYAIRIQKNDFLQTIQAIIKVRLVIQRRDELSDNDSIVIREGGSKKVVLFQMTLFLYCYISHKWMMESFYWQERDRRFNQFNKTGQIIYMQAEEKENYESRDKELMKKIEIYKRGIQEGGETLL
ncbi:unnamed protein product [Paramecium octaurelia]|uniref:Uncharacterized protein n=1 Tax=Paramecium octaurelia TaxID=43137 RepID=A0A8S1Y141_PAROT|nr:unnamed protein product [Paramecium octaurelia]